ncbi:MAG: hypothetical protein P8Y70_14960 [Candidatus Lokiarchaeota archaeon]
MLIRVFLKEGKFYLHIIKDEGKVLLKEYKITHLEMNAALDPLLLSIYSKFKQEIF